MCHLFNLLVDKISRDTSFLVETLSPYVGDSSTKHSKFCLHSRAINFTKDMLIKWYMLVICRVAGADDFTRRLLGILKTVQTEGAQQVYRARARC